MKLFWKKRSRSLVSVDLDGHELFRIAEAPTTVQCSAELTSAKPILTFTDSEGERYEHDLSSAVAGGHSWIHLTVSVNDTYACEAWCRLNSASDAEKTEDEDGPLEVIRFQPFYLPQCSADSAELVGQGLFMRGIHFHGSITPSNVSASCV